MVKSGNQHQVKRKGFINLTMVSEVRSSTAAGAKARDHEIELVTHERVWRMRAETEALVRCNRPFCNAYTLRRR